MVFRIQRLTQQILFKKHSWTCKRHKSHNISKLPPLSEPVANLPEPIYASLKAEHHSTQVSVLSNGIKVASEKRFGEFCTVGVVIDSGPRYEALHLNGINHFLEKLAFKGTSEFEDNDKILNELEKHGGICDAQCSRDTFIYAASATVNGMSSAVKILSETILRPLLTIDDINLARDTVSFEIEALKMRPEQEPLLMDMIHAAAYRQNTLGYPKICPEQNITQIDRRLILSYLKSYYIGSRMVVAGVGVDHQQLVDLVDEYFIQKPPIWHTDIDLQKEPSRIDNSIAQYTGGLVQEECQIPEFAGHQLPKLAHIVVGLEGCSHQDEDFIPICVLNMMMGGGGSFSAGGPGKGMYTRLYTNVLNRYHWIYSATAYNHAYADSGLFCIHASSPPNHIKDLTNIIINEMVRMAGDISDIELNRAKKQLQSMLLMNLESRPVVFEDIGRQVLATGHRKRPEYFINAIDNVTKDDIVRVAQRMLSSQPSVAARGDIRRLPLLKEIQKGLVDIDSKNVGPRSLFGTFCFGCNEIKETPSWNKIYQVKGTLIIPYAELIEPFYAWYDEINNRSRIDYYGGMAKTYQLSNFGQFGTAKKIVPLTNEDVANQPSCLETNGTDQQPVTIQTVLPDLNGFECIGDEVLNGVTTQKWRLVSQNFERINKYTLWVRYKLYPNKTSFMVPIRYEMKGYNTLLGSHYDHYYLDYEYFDTDVIPDSIFEIDQGQKCTGFPGPGINHIYSFNPMKEFVHPASNEHVESEFDKFKKEHNKEYNTDYEHILRFEYFKQNLRYIHSKNRANLGYQLAANHLADKSAEEIAVLRGRQYSGEKYNGGKPFPYNQEEIKKLASNLPESFDWRIHGAVTPVKDQSVCGSCWSFGSTGTIEGAYFLKNGGRLVSLSEQALIDCSWGFGNNGCDGGEDFRAYAWLLKHGGIPTEEDYGSYLGQDGYCHYNSTKLVAKITGFVNVSVNDENALKLALVKNGPISISIDASQRTFSFYSNGVYYDPKCKNGVDQLDHSVLAIGYGKLNGQTYWLVKNSWSTYWGNDGYILMSTKDNNCGVMTAPTYVEM